MELDGKYGTCNDKETFHGERVRVIATDKNTGHLCVTGRDARGFNHTRWVDPSTFKLEGEEKGN